MKKILCAALAGAALALGGCAAQHDSAMSSQIAQQYEAGTIGSIAVLPANNANKIGRYAHLINNTLVDSFAAKNATLQILGPWAATTTLSAGHAATEAAQLIRTYFRNGTVEHAALEKIRTVLGTDAVYLMRFDEIVEEGAEDSGDRGLSVLKSRAAVIDLRTGAVAWTGETYVSRETEKGSKDPEFVFVMDETIDKIISIIPTL